MYIFGGKDDENFKLDDFWRFDMTSKTWTLIESISGPSARAGHTAIVYEGKIFIFGGIYEVTKELNDCFMYDIAKNNWLCLYKRQDDGDLSAQSPTKIMSLGSVSPLPKKN